MTGDSRPFRVRFAPSPTGSTHLGNLRTALFDWLLARRFGGQFVLRIEDTDQGRYTPGTVEQLQDDMRWLGLHLEKTLAGELYRYAIKSATEKKFDLVKKCYDQAEEIITELVDMDLTGYNRQKFDQAKQALQKLEQVVYEVSLKRL